MKKIIFIGAILASLVTSIYALYLHLHNLTHLQQIQQHITAQQQHFNDQIATINHKIFIHKTHNQLIQARKILHLAELNLTLSFDATTALNLYNQAIKLIKEDPLAQNLTLTTFKEQQNLDLTQLLTNFDYASKLVDNLNLILPKYQPITGPENVLPQKLHALRKLVIIRHHTLQIQPLFSEADVNLIRLQLKLKLFIAYETLLNKNQTLYQQTIKQIINEIHTYFDINSANELLQILNIYQDPPFFQTQAELHSKITDLINQLDALLEKSNNIGAQDA